MCWRGAAGSPRGEDDGGRALSGAAHGRTCVPLGLEGGGTLQLG